MQLIDIFKYSYINVHTIRKDRLIREKFITIMSNLCDNDERNLDNPIWIGMKLTNLCNLQCIHCWAKNDSYVPSIDNIKSSFDKFSNNNINFIGLSGGEIFTRNDIFEILEYAKNKKLILELFTNATLLDDKKIKQLHKILDVNVDIFQVSLDAISSEGMQLQRSIGPEKIIENIKLLIKYGFDVRVSYVATHINVSEMFETFKLVSDIGVKGFSTSPVYPKNKGVELNDKLDMSQYYIELLKCIKYSTTCELTYFLQMDFFNRINELISIKHMEKQYNYKYTIPAGYRYMYVSAYGDVYPEFQLEYSKLYFGNIYNESLEDIYKRRNNSIISVERDLKETKCFRCDFLKFCIGHSYEQVFEKYGHFNESNPFCTKEVLNV